MESPWPRRLDDPDTLRGFLRRLRVGVYVTNPRGDIVDANPAFLEMLCVGSLEELRERRVEQVLVDPAARARELEVLHREGSIRDFELEIRCGDGAFRTVLDTAYVHHDGASGEVYYHGIFVDITDRKRLENLLLEQSLRDPLTGCFNRRHLAQLSERLRREDEGWGCIVFDVDRFKHYNDAFGHDAGDTILVRLARFLVRQTREREAVVRMGGDEFAVVMPGADAEATDKVLARVRAPGPKEALVPFSVGWAVREGDEELEKTIQRADQMLLARRAEQRGLPPNG